MRRRILRAMAAIALVTVVVLGVRLAVFGRLPVRRDAAGRADTAAAAVGLPLAARLGARTHPTGVAEVDAVGATLDDGARRIGRLVAAEREFSANASHQLRTPLTAVRMRLEEIEGFGEADVRSEATAALAQVDRLDTTI